jgi:hypothetical protein
MRLVHSNVLNPVIRKLFMLRESLEWPRVQTTNQKMKNPKKESSRRLSLWTKSMRMELMSTSSSTVMTVLGRCSASVVASSAHSYHDFHLRHLAVKSMKKLASSCGCSRRSPSSYSERRRKYDLKKRDLAARRM